MCKLRLAVNTRRKDGPSGEWVDKPNYFDVTVWGAQGENCARYLAKGRGVAVDGRLEWREFQDKQGNKRQAIDIVADNIQFLSGPRDDQPGGQPAQGFTPRSDVPVDTNDFASRTRRRQLRAVAQRRRHPVLGQRRPARLRHVARASDGPVAQCSDARLRARVSVYQASKDF